MKALIWEITRLEYSSMAKKKGLRKLSADKRLQENNN